MDKNFNDQELSDIMKEIEALEEEFEAGPGEETDSESAPDEATSEVVEELAHMSEEEALPGMNRSEPTVLKFDKHEQRASSHTSMSFKVQGDLNLELFFEVGGKTIALEVTESGLAIQMEGGVTFTVPVSGHIKKAV